MQPAAGKIKYDDFNKTDFGQYPLLAQSGNDNCNLKIDIRLVLISGDAMRRRDFSVQVCQLINAPNNCSITSPAVASSGFDRHSPRNYAFGK
jgi:hypothetical protein